MKSFYINPETNDIELDGSNEIKMVEGDEELIQSVRLIITTNLGEWFLNPEHGFDRFAVLGKQIERDVVIDSLYQAILQEERVSRVENVTMEIDKENRKLNISFAFFKQNGDLAEGSVNV